MTACTRCPIPDQRERYVEPSGSGPIMLAYAIPPPEDNAMVDHVCRAAGIEEYAVGYRSLCRPPRGRHAEFPECKFACTDSWESTLTQFNPKVVVLLGTASLPDLWGAQARISRVHGQARAHAGRLWVPTYDPFAANRRRDIENAIVKDLTLAKELADAS